MQVPAQYVVVFQWGLGVMRGVRIALGHLFWMLVLVPIALILFAVMLVCAPMVEVEAAEGGRGDALEP